MEDKAISILNDHGVMAVATNRPDGWPQATMVAYVNEGLRLYFVVSRRSQKLANILRDDRVSAAIGGPAETADAVKGLSLAGHASEVTDDADRRRGVKLLFQRHPGLGTLPPPDFAASALMRIAPRLISIVDFHDELGHTDTIRVGTDDLSIMARAEPADWGLTPFRAEPTD